MIRILHRLAQRALLLAILSVAGHAQGVVGVEVADDFGRTFASATPEQVGIDTEALLALTDWVEHAPPILSLLISRNGKLIYELYTSGCDREQAHYVMSVTKTVVSALVGIAIDAKVLPGSETPVNKLLPRRLFDSDKDFSRFARLTVRQVLAMAALDAPVPPQDESESATKRQDAFWAAPNRVAFALQQPLLPAQRGAFQYNDITPMLAAGMLQYATGQTMFEFAERHLFGPLGFRNFEWMHQDATGIDNASYGLRLRPIDMQKFGVLFLMRGKWADRQVVPRSWIDQSFTPWIRSRAEFSEPNYGWYWWTRRDAKWLRHEANGWRGQRIAVIPEPGLVVTMTACIVDGSEDQVFGKIVDELLPSAVRNGTGAALPAAPAARKRLQARLETARGWPRLGAVEPRMLPSVAAKEARVPFMSAADAPSKH